MFEQPAIRLLTIVISAIFINNYVLTRFLGLCAFVGISQRLDLAMGMGLAMTFVVTMSSIITWPIYHYLLVPFRMEYLNIISFILVIAAFVQLVEMVIHKFNPAMYKALGIYLPLITTNCAVLFVTLLNAQNHLSFIESVVQGASAGAGFWLALILITGIRERLELVKLPRAMQGAAITFVLAGLMSLAFLGFSGLIVE